MFVEGDFNSYIHREAEKNNDNFNVMWSYTFNVIIESTKLVRESTIRKKINLGNRRHFNLREIRPDFGLW
jgi:hypothetical protein